MVKNDKTITIGHLYPDQMNVYGDLGNVVAIKYRLEKRGYTVKIENLKKAQSISSKKIDILIGGGGQDSNQDIVAADLVKYGSELSAMCEDGLVCLMVCGMYQLFGHHFITTEGKKIKGIGLLDVYTEAGNTRMIGNVKAHSKYGTLVGFENHSGNTYLGRTQNELANTYQGYGNNDTQSDSSEGANTLNIFGTYLHGPVLPKNPRFADELIARAVTRKYGSANLIDLDDSLERKTSEHIRRLSY